MDAVVKRTGGRPRSPAPLSAAERMRRYRARLRGRGVRVRIVREPDPLLATMRFAPDTLLTPGEQDVLRRFCAGFSRLPVMPRKAAVFGSRATGGADEHSDLDVAIFLGGARNAEIEKRLSAIAFSAQAPYRSGQYGIFLRPVPLYSADKNLFLDSIRPDLEVIWTRPK